MSDLQHDEGGADERLPLLDVRRLALRPGETLLIRVPEGTMTHERAQAMSERLGEWFPGSHVLIVEGDTEVSIIQPVREEASTG